MHYKTIKFNIKIPLNIQTKICFCLGGGGIFQIFAPPPKNGSTPLFSPPPPPTSKKLPTPLVHVTVSPSSVKLFASVLLF